MDRVKWIESNGKQILYVDYTKLKTTPELLAVLDEQIKVSLSVPGKYLGVSDFTDATISKEFLDKINQAGKEVFEEKAEKGAVIGITGLKSVLFQGYLKFTGAKTTKAFNSREEALAFLAS